jgi:hypothetical protein
VLLDTTEEECEFSGRVMDLHDDLRDRDLRVPSAQHASVARVDDAARVDTDDGDTSACEVETSSTLTS